MHGYLLGMTGASVGLGRTAFVLSQQQTRGGTGSQLRGQGSFETVEQAVQY